MKEIRIMSLTDKLIDKLMEERIQLQKDNKRQSEQDSKFLLMLLLHDVKLNPRRYFGS